MGMSTLQVNFKTQIQWDCSQSVTGSNPVKNTDSYNFTSSFTTGTSGAGGANEQYVTVLSIVASGSTTIDLSSLTDVVRNSAVSLARVKRIYFRLLGASDTIGGDSANQVTGTACSGITIGNAASNPFVGPLGGTTPTITLGNAEEWLIGGAGATGWTVDGTHKNIKVVNNDAGVTAKVLVVITGADA